MEVPDPADVDSDFQVLDEDYDDPEFFGGAFEGSHSFGDMVVLRLYSIVPAEGTETLRIETRHHFGGRVLGHDRDEYALRDRETVAGTDEGLESFCRAHHFDDPVADVRSIIDRLDVEPP